MEALNNGLNFLNDYIGRHEWFVFFLLLTGLFFTIYLKFPQIFYFRHAIRIVRGKYDKEGDEGDTNHFQALATALSGTVGTGNIAGVALAIHIGGPAALFWMLVTAAFGMTTKFVEVTLSHKYREKDSQGRMAGGPMYYMKNKLNLKWLAAIFAGATILSSFGTGSLPQINSISSTMNSTFGVNPMLTGGVLAVLLGIVIIGGIKRIASVTEKLVPGMAIVYFIGAFAVIFANLGNILPSFISIFADVFTGSAAMGGFLGGTISVAFQRGVGRGLFSNEAGQGSAPIAHASAKGHEPVSEGMVALLEPFIDTIIICTVTGLVLLSSGVWTEKHANTFQDADLAVVTGVYDDENEAQREALSKHITKQEKLEPYSGDITFNMGQLVPGNFTVIHARSQAENIIASLGAEPFSGILKVESGTVKRTLTIDGEEQTVVLEGESLVHSAPLTAIAFRKGFFGDAGEYIVTIGLLLFAFSTAISWSYYGDRAVTFLVGAKGIVWYRVVYVTAFFFAAFQDTTIIWTFSELAIALMTIPNLIGILLLRKDMKNSIKEYWAGFKKEYPDQKAPGK